MKSIPRWVALSACAFLAVAGCGRQAVRDSRGADTLSAAERAVALEAVSGSPGFASLTAEGTAFAIGAELVREKEVAPEGGARHALVTTYIYHGDLTVLSTVDLASHAIVDVDTVAHLPTPLAAAEFERAKKLALENPVVANALAPHKNAITFEGLVSHSALETDSLFGHRVVRLLFRVGPSYIAGPVVHVDLTTGTVLVEPAMRDH